MLSEAAARIFEDHAEAGRGTADRGNWVDIRQPPAYILFFHILSIVEFTATPFEFFCLVVNSTQANFNCAGRSLGE